MHRRYSLFSVALALAGAALLASSVTHVAHAVLPTYQETAGPGDGWTLHIDAKQHFPGDPDAIAHHYCKAVAGGLIECLLFDSDAADARLVGVEVIADAATYDQFDPAEQARWHYHKDEIPKVEATLPDLSAEEAAKVVAQIEETYGKLYVLWDPTLTELPVGEPSLTILD
jgi:hypothetical protein